MKYEDIITTMTNIITESYIKDHNFDCTKYIWFIPYKAMEIIIREVCDSPNLNCYVYEPEILGCKFIVCDVDTIYFGKRYEIIKKYP